MHCSHQSRGVNLLLVTFTDCFYFPVKASSLESIDYTQMSRTHAGRAVLPWRPSIRSLVQLWVPLSLVAQKAENLPAMQESQAQPLGWEDPLEEKMASHSSIVAWRIPWTEEPGGLEYMRSQSVRHDWATNTHTHTHTHICETWISQGLQLSKSH